MTLAFQIYSSEWVMLLPVSKLSHYSGVFYPSFIFSWTTIANISAYFKCIVSYCRTRENETCSQFTLNNERLTLVNISFSSAMLI